MDATTAQEVLQRLIAAFGGAGVDMVAIVSAAVAILGALFSWRETRRQSKLQVAALRHDLDATSIAWGNEAIAAMADAGELAVARDVHLSVQAFKEKRLSLLSRISALVDRGRLLFPNIDEEDHGADKDGAYRGVRPPILDALMYTYYEVNEMEKTGGPTAWDSAGFIIACRRLLVSELQAHLDPKRRNEIVDRFDHRKEFQREEAMYKAGRLGLDLNVRRPGILTRFNDRGFTDFAQQSDIKERFETETMNDQSPPQSAYFIEDHKSDAVVTRTLAAIVDNEPGVLARVVGLFAARGYNIESLTVAEVDRKKHQSRITIVTSGTVQIIEQIKAQLLRLVPVERVVDISLAPAGLERELALVKVKAPTGSNDRVEALRIAEHFRPGFWTSPWRALFSS